MTQAINPVRWGVLGAARIARSKVIPALQASPWCQLQAVGARDPAVARQRLLGLLQRIAAADLALDAAIRVRGRGGLSGEFGFEVMSTIGRELVFAASHAIHHHAMLTQHCEQHGIVVDARLGRAPATVAHALAIGVRNEGSAPTKKHPNQEPTCNRHPATA